MLNKKTLLLAVLCFSVLMMCGISIAKVTKNDMKAYVVDKWAYPALPDKIWNTNGNTFHGRTLSTVLQYESEDPRFNGLCLLTFNVNLNMNQSNLENEDFGTMRGTFHFEAGEVLGTPGQKYIQDVIGVWDGNWTLRNEFSIPNYYPSGGALTLYVGGGIGHGSLGFEGMKFNFKFGYDDIGEYSDVKIVIESSAK